MIRALKPDWTVRDSRYWRDLFGSIYRAHPTDQQLARAIIDVIRQRRFDEQHHALEWHEIYPDDAVGIRAELSKAMRECNDRCIDNERVARLGHSSAMRRYRRQQRRGCCGSYDAEIVVGGRRYKIGFNYGH